MIGKFESSKFWNCPSKTEILLSYFEISNRESKSQQKYIANEWKGTKMNDFTEKILWNISPFVNFCRLS